MNSNSNNMSENDKLQLNKYIEGNPIEQMEKKQEFFSITMVAACMAFVIFWALMAK